MPSTNARAGRVVQQAAGYRAFLPAPLPPDPPLHIDIQILQLLSRADQALGRLDGVAQTLPNPDLFVAMYIRQEAVYSSQIEGTQSTLDDVLEFELDASGREIPRDAEEVVNYVRAMNYGLSRLPSLPLSLRLIREIHSELLQGVRGAERSPGEFRTSQNWIGAANASLSEATFVPPPPAELMNSLDAFEKYLHTDHGLPVLITAGLAHAQFETIHPFLDGNGRVGRLLITFILCYHDVLHQPLLYLSLFLRRHRAEYYDRLTAIRMEGDWEGWLKFFLRGVGETAEEATTTARAILMLREEHRMLVRQHQLSLYSEPLLDLLFERPLININLVRDQLGVVYRTAAKLVDRFVELGLLEEITGAQRNRRFRYAPYLALFSDHRISGERENVAQVTEP